MRRAPRPRQGRDRLPAGMIGVALLAFVAGCTDALGYLRFRTFAGLMTGNTVFLGLALFGHAPGLCCKPYRDPGE